MNAPESIVALTSLPTVIPVASICASPSNPRKHFDQTKLTELATSIKKHGVLQPILTRPIPRSQPSPEGFSFEIVCGERRWRAAKIAELTDIPAFSRELSDQEVLEIQIVENLQREDVHALEEAEGYERLMNDYGYAVEQLADKTGKSKAYIYARLKLTALCPAARKAFYDGTLNPSTALLVARIPVAKLQEKAVGEIAGGRYANDEPMSFRSAQNHIQDHYMLRLAEAPFPRGDESLVPGAGRCHDCLKRTGNQKDLFSDVKSADVCTDPQCFDAKKLAYVELQKSVARAAGRKIIEGAEAEKIKPNNWSDDLNGGYVDLDKKLYRNGKQVTVRQLLGKDVPVTDLLIDPHHAGSVIEVVSKATIEEKLRAKGSEIPFEIKPHGRSTAEKDAARKQKLEVTYRQRLFDSVRSKLTIDFDTRIEEGLLDLREFRLVAGRFFNLLQFEDQKRLARLWIGADGKADDHGMIKQLKDRIDSMDRKDCGRLMLESCIVGDVQVPSWSDRKPEHLMATAEALGVDAATIKNEVATEAGAKAKQKAQATNPKAVVKSLQPAANASSKKKKAVPPPSSAAQAKKKTVSPRPVAKPKSAKKATPKKAAPKKSMPKKLVAKKQQPKKPAVKKTR
jgi:ParB/RepB/Spo0J family partition protein